MRSRLLAAILTVTLCASILVGCGTKDTAVDGAATSSSAAKTSKGLSGEITVLHHRTDMGKQMEAYITKFKADNPEAKINMEAITDYQQTIMTRINTKDYGDVLMIPAELTKNQYPDFFAKLGGKADFEKQYLYLDKFTVDEKVYGLSIGAIANGFVYNEKVLKDAGVTKLPTSTDEYISVLKQIKEKTDAIPYYTNYANSWPLTAFSNTLQISLSGDPDYMNKMLTNKNEFLPGSKTYEALNLLYQAVAQGLCEEKPAASDWERSRQMMADGEIGFMALGTWAIGQIKELSKNPENIKFMPAPSINKGKSYVEIGSDYGVGVNINSEHKDLATAFAKFLCREYPKGADMISSVIGDEMPEYLKDVPNMEKIEAKQATTKQALAQETISKEAVISLSDSLWIKPIVDIGLDSSKLSFDDYMKKLNTQWVEGITKVEQQEK